MTEQALVETAWIVQDYVNQNDGQIDCDNLKEWLDEYAFYSADCK